MLTGQPTLVRSMLLLGLVLSFKAGVPVQQAKPTRVLVAKATYGHAGTVGLEAADTYRGPNSYRVWDDDGSETCEFLDHDVFCQRDPKSKMWLHLDDGTKKQIATICGDSSVRNYFGKDKDPDGFFFTKSYIAFLYRMDGNKMYVPYHDETGNLFISTEGNPISGEACFVLVGDPPNVSLGLHQEANPTLIPPPTTLPVDQNSQVTSQGSPGPAKNVSGTPLAAKIEILFHTIITTDDDAQEAATRDEVIGIYKEHGLLIIAEVGDEASYEFVVLLASDKVPQEMRAQILAEVKVAVAQGELSADAGLYYEARLRIENAKRAAEAHAPTNPDLRDQIERMSKVDQAVRQQEGFDVKKMAETDRENASPLQAILDRYGAPTFAMVGTQAAADFVVMIQHQSPQFSEQALPKLKAAVDAGQADPGSFAMAYDRSQSNLGKKQFYGEKLVCKAGEKLHEEPIEDEAHVNQRRAELGLVRVEIYARIAAEMMPQFCPAAGGEK
jgi:hypothetical protein